MDSESASSAGANDATKGKAEPKAAGFQFECNLCGEECFGVPSIINRRHPYVVDEECVVESVVPQILAAKASEYSYPPVWGNVVIDVRHFYHFLPKSTRLKDTTQGDVLDTELT